MIPLTSHSVPPSEVESRSRYPMTLTHSPRVNLKSSTNIEISTPTTLPKCVTIIIPVSTSYESTLISTFWQRRVIPSQESQFPSLVQVGATNDSRNRTNNRRRRIRRPNISHQHASRPLKSCAALISGSQKFGNWAQNDRQLEFAEI